MNGNSKTNTVYSLYADVPFYLNNCKHSEIPSNTFFFFFTSGREKHCKEMVNMLENNTKIDTFYYIFFCIQFQFFQIRYSSLWIMLMFSRYHRTDIWNIISSSCQNVWTNLLSLGLLNPKIVVINAFLKKLKIRVQIQ